MVEMALVMPILLFLALGIVDFGRAMNYWNDANQLAADGARYAAVNHSPGTTTRAPVDDDFRDWIRRQADTGELQDGTIAAQPLPDGHARPTPPRPRRPGAAGLRRDPAGCRSASASRVRARPLTGDLAVGKPVEVVVETSYNLIPFLGQETQFGSVEDPRHAVMRLEQTYTMETGCKAAGP